jgi:hypothetical protein
MPTTETLFALFGFYQKKGGGRGGVQLVNSGYEREGRKIHEEKGRMGSEEKDRRRERMKRGFTHMIP